MKLRTTLASAALLALSATVALAQNPPGPPPGGGMGMRQGGPGRRLQMLLNGITLTAQQQARVDSIEAKYQPQMRALFTPGQRPDSAAQARMTDLRNSENVEIRAVLTPDQQKVFDTNVSAMPPMGGPRRGPPGGP
jgi:Spy/CpxP family protein refolding chaperone